MATVKCGKCKKTYNNDAKFFDGEIRCPFCNSKSLYSEPKQNVMLEQYKKEQELKKYNDFKYTLSKTAENSGLNAQFSDSKKQVQKP